MPAHDASASHEHPITTLEGSWASSVSVTRWRIRRSGRRKACASSSIPSRSRKPAAASFETDPGRPRRLALHPGRANEPRGRTHGAQPSPCRPIKRQWTISSAAGCSPQMDQAGGHCRCRARTRARSSPSPSRPMTFIRPGAGRDVLCVYTEIGIGWVGPRLKIHIGAWARRIPERYRGRKVTDATSPVVAMMMRGARRPIPAARLGRPLPAH